VLAELKDLLKSKDLKKSIEILMAEKAELQKKLELLESEKTQALKLLLKAKVVQQGDLHFLIEEVEISNAEQLKNLSFQLRQEIPNLVCILGCGLNQKPLLSIILADELVQTKQLNAGNLVKQLAKHIQGGGGGQPFYATAGGNKLEGLKAALEEARGMFK
jgi:alanyl-tRNA synthetase